MDRYHSVDGIAITKDCFRYLQRGFTHLARCFRLGFGSGHVHWHATVRRCCASCWMEEKREREQYFWKAEAFNIRFRALAWVWNSASLALCIMHSMNRTQTEMACTHLSCLLPESCAYVATVSHFSRQVCMKKLPSWSKTVLVLSLTSQARSELVDTEGSAFYKECLEALEDSEYAAILKKFIGQVDLLFERAKPGKNFSTLKFVLEDYASVKVKCLTARPDYFRPSGVCPGAVV